MKTQEDIDREVNATLEIASKIAQVTPSSDLKRKILAQIKRESATVVVPFYRRVAFVAAAAVVILALNTMTVIYFTHKAATDQQSLGDLDRLADIRTAYDLDASTF